MPVTESPAVGDRDPQFVALLESAAHLQRLVPGAVLVGDAAAIEAGVRQMIRKRPLEVAEVSLPSGGELTVPTIAETLRIKAFLIVRRNQTRDYLDLAALSEHLGVERAAAVLTRIDDYYADQHEGGDGVASQLLRQLSDPLPADRSVIGQLASYRRLHQRWSDWSTVTDVLESVASGMASQ